MKVLQFYFIFLLYIAADNSFWVRVIFWITTQIILNLIKYITKIKIRKRKWPFTYLYIWFFLFFIYFCGNIKLSNFLYFNKSHKKIVKKIMTNLKIIIDIVIVSDKKLPNLFGTLSERNRNEASAFFHNGQQPFKKICKSL